jgi:hypothetical protein
MMLPATPNISQNWRQNTLWSDGGKGKPELCGIHWFADEDVKA